ncbi:fibronectin type III domain-containing protein [Eubacterium sp.]|uniref:fibronectin type III domain-containing protein n=1 Tax=Eubacterium sp. TaxID=142586 RepID=UPI0025E5E86F|nr:fibronectin type III domain-containing protein [Eubacterium sp.]MCR5628659.1 fibronectin type III domain-containing protein [Eubacterium sp.]
MKLFKKFGLLATTTVATVMFGCMAYGMEQTNATTSSATVEFGSANRVTWQLAEDSNFTNITRQSGSNGKLGTERIYSGKKTFYDLPSGKSYWVRYMNQGDSAWRESKEIVTTPTYGSGAKVSETGCTVGTASLKWDESSGATSYEVISNNVVLATPTGTETTINISASTTVKIYPVRKASTTDFVAKSSNYISTDVKPAPGKISKVKYDGTNYSGINIKWDSIQGADGYEMQYCTYKGKGKTIVDRTNWNNYTYASISKPKRILYRVKARAYVKIAGQKFYGEWSPEKYVCKDLNYEDVKLKSASTRKSNRISVSWNKMSGAKKYVVYMAKDNAAGFKKIKTTKKRAIVVTKFKGRKLSTNTSYYFRVIAVGKAGKKKFKTPKDLSKGGTLYRYYY